MFYHKNKDQKKKKRSEWGCDSEQEWEEECGCQGGRREAVYGPPFLFFLFCISWIYAIIYMDNMNWRKCVQKLTNLLQSHDTGFGLASACNWPHCPIHSTTDHPFASGDLFFTSVFTNDAIILVCLSCVNWFIFYFCIYEWYNNTFFFVLCQYFFSSKKSHRKAWYSFYSAWMNCLNNYA